MSKKKRKKSGKQTIQHIEQEMWDGEKVIIVKKTIKHRKPN